MSLKRHNTSSPELDEDDRPSKRQRPAWIDEFDTFEHPTTREQPRVDVSSGQQSAFPGLDDEDDELIYGDPEDGLQYLRMVRSERKNVPHILVAEKDKQMTPGDGIEDSYEVDNYHPDRAWISAPNEDNYEALDSLPDAQDLYYLSLLDRFANLQARLRLPPPLSSIELLTSAQPISLPPDTAKAREKWRHVTKHADPSATQLACMDPETVMELVKLLTEGMNTVIKSRVQSKIKRLGGWIWATLGRCRDRGELSSEEIAELRELGKRAAQLLDYVRRSQSLEAEHPAVREEHIANRFEEGEFAAVTGVSSTGTAAGQSEEGSGELKQAKAEMARLLGIVDENSPMQAAKAEKEDVEPHLGATDVDKQVRMVLDTILTIVGEVYGQRDLLEHRDVWE